MAAQSLDEVIPRARALLRRLEDAQVPVRFLMVTLDEDDEPQILLETPLFTEIGLRRTYDYFFRLARAVEDDALLADDLILIRPKSRLAQYFGGFGASITDTGIRGTSIDGVRLDGMVIVSRPAYSREEAAASAKAMMARIKAIEAAAA